MKLASKEVEMGAELVVPTGLGLVFDGLLHLGIVVGGVLDGHVALGHSRKALPYLALLVAEDVGEHLYVVSSGTESLAHHGIEVAATAEVEGETEFRKQFAVSLVGLVLKTRHKLAGEVNGYLNHLSSMSGHHHCALAAEGEHRLCGIFYRHLLIVVAQTEGERETVEEVDVRLMIYADVPLRCAECAWH